MILLQESQQPRMGEPHTPAYWRCYGVAMALLGVETGPSQELVSQMLQEAMGGAGGGASEETTTKERSK